MPTVNVQSNFANSSWVITRYDHALSNEATYVSDTLHFINTETYTINGSDLARRYVLSGNNTKYLKIYSLTTLGGDFSSTLDEFSIDDGYINSAIFNDLHVVDSMEHGYALVWMHRID